MKEQPNKKPLLTDIQKREQAQEGKQALIEQLIRQADEFANQKYSDINLDRENEKIKLLGGSEISLREVKDIISNSLQRYSATFPQIFYDEIDRLNNWQRSADRKYERPNIVARWTLEIIYWRFSKEIVPVLQQLNPYIGIGLRLHKHFQWLTDDGKMRLEGFIEDSIREMKQCTTWYEFRVKYAQRYGLPIQLRLWEKDQFQN